MELFALINPPYQYVDYAIKNNRAKQGTYRIQQPRIITRGLLILPINAVMLNR